MAFDNNTDKLTFIKKTGSEVISNNYKIDISSLLDSTTRLSESFSDQDEFTVIRKFDDSTISPAITADETWSSWTLANNSASGSTMYSLSEGTITFSTTAADYTWTTTQSGRAADVVLPALASGDTVYVLRKTYNEQKIVNWTSGSKITSSNLNLSSDQMLFLNQEILSLWHNFHTMNPSVGQPNGVCPLDSSGTISNTYIGTTTLDLTAGDGITGSGTAASPIAVDLAANSGLVISSAQLKADTVDNVTTTDAFKPLSANQGKLIQDQIDAIGAGIVYKGAVDLALTDDVTTGAISGWTFAVIGAASIDDQWTGLTSASVGDLIRYDGTNWDVVSSTSALQSDGSIPLDSGVTLTTTAGTVVVATQTDNDNSTKAASTAYTDTAIGATPVDGLSDVASYGTPTNGDVLKWTTTEWVLDSDSFRKTDTLKDISDVGTGTPSTNDALVWDGSSWTPTTVPTLTSTQVTCGGVGDGAVDESSNVDDAMNDANLGHIGSPGSSTQTLCSFSGRTYKIGSNNAVYQQPEIPWKQDITFANGTFNFDLGNAIDKNVFETNASPTTLSTTSAAPIAYRDTKVKVLDVTGFAVGDYIQIQATTTDDKSTMFNDNSGTKIHGLLTTAIVSIDTTNKILHLSDPIPFATTAASGYGTGLTVSRSGGGAEGVNQIKNMVFDNLKFKDVNWDVIYLGTNAIDYSSVGGTTASVELRTGHGMLAGGAIRLQDVDASNAELQTANQFDTINNQFTIDSIATDAATFTLANSGTCNTNGNGGGSAPILQVSSHNGIELKYGHDVVFKNCTFDGFNNFAVSLYRCKNVLFDNCTFKNVNGLGFYDAAIRISECDSVTVRECTFNNCCTCILVTDDNSYASRNIKVHDNNMTYTDTGVYISTFIHDNFDFINNSCTVIPLNPARVHHGRKLTETVRSKVSAVYCERSIDNCKITGNNCNNMVKQPITPWDITKYWGWGDGIEWYTGTGADPTSLADAALLPGHEYGFYIGMTGYELNTTGRSTGTTMLNVSNSSYVISNNSIATHRMGIGAKLWYNRSSSFAITKIGGIRINDNTIEYTFVGIAVIQARANPLGASFMGVFKTTISNNVIGIIRFVKHTRTGGFWLHMPGLFTGGSAVYEEGYRGDTYTATSGEWHQTAPWYTKGIVIHYGLYLGDNGTGYFTGAVYSLLMISCNNISVHSQNEVENFGVQFQVVQANVNNYYYCVSKDNVFFDLSHAQYHYGDSSAVHLGHNSYGACTTTSTDAYGAWLNSSYNIAY